jgi:hypothetical protein
MTTVAATAEDWAVNSLEGTARTFARGAWEQAKVGDQLTPDILVESAGRMRLARGPQSLSLGAGARIRIEHDDASLVRAFEGALGATVDVGAGESFLVMTTFASIEARLAIFGLFAERDGADLAVRDGVVRVTDLITRRSFELRAGQSLRLHRGFGEADIHAPKPDDLALLAANASPAGKTRSDSEAAAAAALDRSSLGGVGPAGKAKGDPKADRDAVDAARDFKGKPGKASARDMATATAVTRELMQDPEYEVDPLDDSYQWTQVEDGVVRLKPIWRVIADLHGAERYQFWIIVAFACLGLGGLAGFALQNAGLGLTGNTLLVMTAFAAAILVRDLFFRSGGYIQSEPYLSLGLMLGAMPAFLLAGAAAKLRLA